MWVPVMPATTVPAEYFNGSCGERGGVTWRRYAFERAHMTFLEAHRPPGAAWQALKRMFFLAYNAQGLCDVDQRRC
eukprot:3099696-Karenia_brevis.AAC.1